MSVTFTGMPAAIVSSIAGRPSGVAGVFLKTLGRAARAGRRLGPPIARSGSCAGVQALGLLDRALGVVREVGVDLERHPAVPGVLAHAIPLGPQNVARSADVLDGERQEDLLGIGLRLEHLAQLVVVGVAVGDRRLE